MKRPSFPLLFGLVYAAAVAQVALRNDLAVRGLRPDFLWAVVAWFAFGLEGGRAVAWAALGGLIADCLAPGPLGPGTLLATIATWIVQRSRAVRPAEEGSSVWIGRSLFVLFTVTSCSWIRWEVLEATGTRTSVLIHAAGDALYTVLFGLAVSLVVFPLRRLRSSASPTAETPQTLTNQWKMLTP